MTKGQKSWSVTNWKAGGRHMYCAKPAGIFLREVDGPLEEAQYLESFLASLARCMTDECLYPAYNPCNFKFIRWVSI